ncbi:3-hydroxyacyl-CoA dehydrogenase NAD-binding domain-containing protein [Pusillimonas sp.]|uniref:3-hydroxyacyl-CoA dehydrogenase NAD-binding domain-containing protein n=1 Tax=Pusillimonas sp. TaxID=3040095 RepID=UPI0037C782EB
MSSSHEFFPPPSQIERIAVLGLGSVGASWAALFMARGLEVVAYDPAPDARARARSFISQAWPALIELGRTKAAEPEWTRLRFVESPAAAAREAQVIQENIPEKPGLKTAVLAEVDAAAEAYKIVLSSTGGIPPTQMQAGLRHPERLVVLHPFNPAHLIPLVEVVGGKQTLPEVAQWAMDFARYVGKRPIRLHTEASGHMTNRLQFALMREAVACLVEGIASAGDIDTAVRYGLAPRWALMGGLMTLHLAGGEGGMKGILDHAGDAIQQWWQPGPEPRLTPEVIERLVEAAQEVSAGRPINDWVQWRDRSLVEVLSMQTEIESGEPGYKAGGDTDDN